MSGERKTIAETYSADPDVKVDVTRTPAGRAPKMTVSTYQSLPERRQCSFCRGDLYGQVTISMGGYNSRRMFHRGCFQWILDESNEKVPDPSGWTTAIIRKQRLDAAVQEFVDEHKERILERERARRSL